MPIGTPTAIVQAAVVERTHTSRAAALSHYQSLNASVRSHRANIDRGYIRVVGLTPVTALLAFGLAGMDTRILNAWYTSRGLPETWATALAEPPDERAPQRQHCQFWPGVDTVRCRGKFKPGTFVSAENYAMGGPSTG